MVLNGGIVSAHMNMMLLDYIIESEIISAESTLYDSKTLVKQLISTSAHRTSACSSCDLRVLRAIRSSIESNKSPVGLYL